jgi:hypothetical protein
MSIIHLVVFVLQFFLVIPALLWLFQRAKKDGMKRSKLLAVVVAVICYASLNSYFHRYLILSDAYYIFGDLKKSRDVAEKGFKLTENKSEIYDVIYGRYSLYRKMKRAEEKEKPDSKQSLQPK